MYTVTVDTISDISVYASQFSQQIVQIQRIDMHVNSSCDMPKQLQQALTRASSSSWYGVS